MRPSVLYVSNFLPGSNAPYAADLSARLEARAWTVSRTSTLESKIRRLADMMATAWRMRNRFEVAIVDVFSGPAFLWAEATCLELAALRKPFVLTLHGGNLPTFGQRWPRRVKRLLQAATVVTAPSDYNRSEMRRYRDDITLVRNAVDASVYPFRVRDRAAPKLIWVRAFHALYNPVLAVEVLARVARRFPDARLTMLGPDKQDGSLEKTQERAAELGVADRIEITGRVPHADVIRRLGEADILINTTNVDNTPLSLLEAMASGVCVVSTSVGGIPFLVRNGDEALLVPKESPDEMAAAVMRLLEEPALAARLSAAGRKLAMQHDWSVILPQWEALLERVAHA